MRSRMTLVMVAVLLAGLALLALGSLVNRASARVMKGVIDRRAVGPALVTRYVASGGDCGGATPCYPTVQQAVDAADAGDWIKGDTLIRKMALDIGQNPGKIRLV